MSGEKYVILDTNIWVYQTRFPGTPLGAALLHFMLHTGRKLALPEVVELEVQKHTVQLLREAHSKIEAGYRDVATMIGSCDNYQLPSFDEIESRFAARLADLDQLIVKVPFSFDHAKGALTRLMEKSAPNERKQQFKDSAIWEAFIETWRRSDVDFITQDLDFFEGKKGPKTLAASLRSEIAELPNKLRVFSDADQYLSACGEKTPTLDWELVTTAILSELEDRLQKDRERYGYSWGELIDKRMSGFLTETVGRIAVKFGLDYAITGFVPRDAMKQVWALLRIEGECLYRTVEQAAVNIRLDEVSIRDREHPDHSYHRGVYAHVGDPLLFGRGAVPHSFRAPIDADSHQP